jgi:pyridoxal phosphate enzyme (YggS family)
METSGELENKLARVNEKIMDACKRAGRSREEVKLLPVSKTHPPEKIAALARLGVKIFGENKVQEARAKIPLCPSYLEWHMVGHLQSNKVKDAVQLFKMIHSVDSVKLMEGLEEVCDRYGIRMPILLEVNMAGEASKFGFMPESLHSALKAGEKLKRVEIRGLMTIPPVVSDSEQARFYFRNMRELRDKLRKETGYELPELSMGMSNDFEVAIEEGSTIVRIGTMLFGERNYYKKV